MTSARHDKDREQRSRLTSDCGWRQKKTKGAGFCGPRQQEKHGERPRMTSDDDRDDNGRDDDEGPRQRERSEGLVIEKVPREGRTGRRDGGLPGERFGKQEEAREHGPGDRVIEAGGQVLARHNREGNRDGRCEERARERWRPQAAVRSHAPAS